MAWPIASALSSFFLHFWIECNLACFLLFYFFYELSPCLSSLLIHSFWYFRVARISSVSASWLLPISPLYALICAVFLSFFFNCALICFYLLCGFYYWDLLWIFLQSILRVLVFQCSAVCASYLLFLNDIISCLWF